VEWDIFPCLGVDKIGLEFHGMRMGKVFVFSGLQIKKDADTP